MSIERKNEYGGRDRDNEKNFQDQKVYRMEQKVGRKKGGEG